MHEVIALRFLGGYRLWLKFEDGEEGEIDMKHTFKPQTNLFAPFKDPKYFAKVRLIRALGTIRWPNGVDVCPDLLHERVTGTRVRWRR